MWGSYYETDSKRWGYACCKGFVKAQQCTAPAEEEAKAASSDDESVDSSKERAKLREAITWNDLPTELEERKASLLGADGKLEEADEIGRKAASWKGNEKEETEAARRLIKAEHEEARKYLTHFIRFWVGQWLDKLQRSDFAGFSDVDQKVFNVAQSLKQVQDWVAPLLMRLRNKEDLNYGEKEGDLRKGYSRETRTSMESKFVDEGNVLQQLDRMVTLASKREYRDAHAMYVRMTLGNKKWNGTCVLHVPACQMKGAREYRRNRDSLNTYDSDPVSQRYMHALRKLIQFAQACRRNDDESKNVNI